MSEIWFGTDAEAALSASISSKSRSVMSDSLWPHGLQHARPPYPSPSPGVYSNSCPLSQWCHPTVSSSVVSFSSRLQSFPASGSFQTRQLFPSGGWSAGYQEWAKVAAAAVSTQGADDPDGGTGVDVREEGPRGKGYVSQTDSPQRTAEKNATLWSNYISIKKNH